MLLIEGFLPKMLEQNFGRIINTTSGIKNQPEQGAYAASKGALDKLTKDLVNQLATKDVTINLADPGWVRTDLGGADAHHEVGSVIPGMVLGAFVEKGVSGEWISAQKFAGKTLDEALALLEREYAKTKHLGGNNMNKTAPIRY